MNLKQGVTVWTVLLKWLEYNPKAGYSKDDNESPPRTACPSWRGLSSTLLTDVSISFPIQITNPLLFKILYITSYFDPNLSQLKFRCQWT